MSSFIEQLKLAIPDYLVLDLSSISPTGLHKSFEMFEQDRGLVGVIISNPSNQNWLRVIADLPDQMEVKYLMTNGSFTTSYSVDVEDEEVIRRIRSWVQMNSSWMKELIVFLKGIERKFDFLWR